MSNHSTELKCTWTNALIWALVGTAVSVLIRFVMWFMMVWQGDTSIFSDFFCYASLPMLLASALIPVIFYMVMYRKYMKLAAGHPEDLHGVAIGRHGKPLILPLILMIVFAILWILVTTVIVIISSGLSVFLNPDDMFVTQTFLILSAVNLVLDVVVMLLGNRFFKPNLVQRNH